MLLNRSSYWTTKQGLTLQVRNMTLAEVAAAILYIEELQFDLIGDDPYIIDAICYYSDSCPTRTGPIHSVNNATLDQWYEFFNKELDYRSERIAKYLCRSKIHPKIEQSFVQRLVKLLKFW